MQVIRFPKSQYDDSIDAVFEHVRPQWRRLDCEEMMIASHTLACIRA
jgi:hypothetical protein